MLLIVVPQNGELSQASFEPPENRLDPLDHIVVLDDIAGDQEQVGGPGAAGVDDQFEEMPLEARSEVEVAELDDLQPVERAGQARDRHLPLAKAEPE